MRYDWPTEDDWKRGEMLSAPHQRGERDYRPWNFIHFRMMCRWEDCDFHHPEVPNATNR